MRPHPVFYFGLLKPYRDPSMVDHETLAPKKVAMPQVEESIREDPVVLQDSPLGHEDHAPRVLIRQRRVEIHRPPPALVNDQGDQQCHVERIIQRRRRDGQDQ
uniref:Uncharacterized protein n=1 Tax=Peronospora matthiolae TaxID=2874970 RepID=A0AAV1VB33_9STRA